MLSTRSLPPSISELPSPHRSLRAPPEEGLVLHTNGFPGAFSKGAKRGLGKGVSEGENSDTFFPLVNSIFILHPQDLYMEWRG